MKAPSPPSLGESRSRLPAGKSVRSKARPPGGMTLRGSAIKDTSAPLVRSSRRNRAVAVRLTDQGVEALLPRLTVPIEHLVDEVEIRLDLFRLAAPQVSLGEDQKTRILEGLEHLVVVRSDLVESSGRAWPRRAPVVPWSGVSRSAVPGGRWPATGVGRLHGDRARPRRRRSLRSGFASRSRRAPGLARDAAQHAAEDESVDRIEGVPVGETQESHGIE